MCLGLSLKNQNKTKTPCKRKVFFKKKKGRLILNKNEQAGIDKKSFSLPFNGGEIFCEHLDGMNSNITSALSKFESDKKLIKRPSTSSFLAINLDETEVDDNLFNAVLNFLLSKEKKFRKVAFIGISKKYKKEFSKQLQGCGFEFAFIDDFQKAKEWLLP